MNFIYDLHRTMMSQKLILVYQGDFTQETTKSILAMAERNIDSSGEDANIKRKVFSFQWDGMVGGRASQSKLACRAWAQPQHARMHGDGSGRWSRGEHRGQFEYDGAGCLDGRAASHAPEDGHAAARDRPSAVNDTGGSYWSRPTFFRETDSVT